MVAEANSTCVASVRARERERGREACKNFPSTLRNDEHDDDACCLEGGGAALKFSSSDRRRGETSDETGRRQAPMLPKYAQCFSLIRPDALEAKEAGGLQLREQMILQ